jgi:hypothetical protein
MNQPPRLTFAGRRAELILDMGRQRRWTQPGGILTGVLYD